MRNDTYRSGLAGHSAWSSQSGAFWERNSTPGTDRRRISAAACAANAAPASPSAASGPPFTQNGTEISELPNSRVVTWAIGKTPTMTPSRWAIV
ncbi:MAG TPA: hypothetical protein VGH36_14020 [Acetobacteraceae bacterium]